VILSYDGHDIHKMRDLPLAVAETAIGKKEQVKLWRDGHEATLEPVIAAMPANPERVARNEPPAPPQPQATTTMGLKLEPLTPDLRRDLHVPRNVNGVVVTSVSPAGPLAELGLAPGDVIQAINREAVHAPKDVSAKLAAFKKDGGKNLLLLINRHGINQYVALTVGAGDKG